LSRFKNNQFDIVCLFDVMALVPEQIREEFITEITRVTRKSVIFRTHVVNHREPTLENGFHGQDGCYYKYWTFEKYVKSFELTKNKMQLQSCVIMHQCEAIFYFLKLSEPLKSLVFPNFI
jgi:hypothetical protein